MTELDRKAAILESVLWWSPERAAWLARDWYLSNAAIVMRIRANQWEWFRRVGEKATTMGEYMEGIDKFLHGDPPRSTGAVDRDRTKKGWGYPGLAESLVETIRESAQPEASFRSEALETEAADLSGEQRKALKERAAVQQARAFVKALVMRVRAGSRDK